MKGSLKELQNGSDIRGVAIEGVEGELVNLGPEECIKIGKAFVRFLVKTLYRGAEIKETLKIGVGRDVRLSSETLSNALKTGILQCNFDNSFPRLSIEVYDTGLSTTPAMFMSTVFMETQFSASVMVTASHLPYNRNGIKFFTSGGGLEKENIKEILSQAEHENTLSFFDSTKCFSFDLMTLYREHLRGEILSEIGDKGNEKPLSGTKIVVDAGNGSGGFFEEILRSLGSDTRGSVFLSPDGHFPNHAPNPENALAIKSLVQATVDAKADLGIIFDADVDRMSCVFETGEVVNRDKIIALTASILAPKYPESTIVTDSVTSNRLTRFLENTLHLHHFRYMRGYKNVIDKEKELNDSGTVCPLAMETSGHGALSENYYLDDGAFLAAKIIGTLARLERQGKRLSALLDRFEEVTEECEFRVKIDRKDYKEYGKAVFEEARKRAIEKGFTLPESYEGVRISFETDALSGWILIRMSLHDPCIPVNIESEKVGGLEKLIEITRDLLSGFTSLVWEK